jgi:hypothetical protein
MYVGDREKKWIVTTAARSGQGGVEWPNEHYLRYVGDLDTRIAFNTIY